MSENEKFSIDIDPEALDVEWLDQPSRMLEATECLAEARTRVATRKLARDVEEAKVMLNVKKCPSDYGLEKPTVDVIKATVLLDDGVQLAYRKLHSAEGDVGLFTAAVQSLDHRKKALENLVTLHGQQYFAGPSSPRSVKKLNMSIADKRETRSKGRR